MHESSPSFLNVVQRLAGQMFWGHCCRNSSLISMTSQLYPIDAFRSCSLYSVIHTRGTCLRIVLTLEHLSVNDAGRDLGGVLVVH